MNLQALLFVVLAPLPFWFLGLPWFTGNGTANARLAPLVGCALAGLYAEFALVANLPVRASVGAMVLVSGGVASIRWRALRDSLGQAFSEWAPIYLVAVLAASLSPFPVLGNWSGDWLLLYQMGQSVLQGDLPVGMLARPPLFGAAAAPLWIFGSGGLISYQLMAAVASAAAVTATLAAIDHFWPKPPRILVLPLLLSPFFLHHTAAAWSKFLAGGLILSAVIAGLRSRRLASAALLGLAVAVHEGSIIWAPCVLLAHATGPAGWRGALRALWPMAALGLLIAGPLQIWILAKYGLTAKVAASPVLTDLDQTPFALKTLLAVVTSFVGWGPVTSLARWLGNSHPAASSVVAKEGYWLITSWVTTLAGTLAGLLFPFLLARRVLRFPEALRARLHMGPWTFATVGFAVLANALLTALYSNEGTMQAALVPLALGLYGLLAGQLVVRDVISPVPRMAWIVGVVGTLPWLVLNLGTSTGLWLSPAFRERIRTGSEGDYLRVIDNHLAPLGIAAFPEVPLLCIVLLALSIVLYRRGRSGSPGQNAKAKALEAGDRKGSQMQLVNEGAP